MTQPSSGTNNFDLDVEELIEEAVFLCGANPEELSATAMRSFRRSINLIFSDWSVKGINFWKMEQRVLDLTPGTYEYDLPREVLGIQEASIRNSNTNTDVQINKISINEYQGLADKFSQGRPSQFVFDRQITPRIILWQVPDSSAPYQFVYWSWNMIEDVTKSYEGLNVPPRWLNALTYELAARIAIKLPETLPERVGFLEGKAAEFFRNAADDEIERSSFYIEPVGIM